MRLENCRLLVFCVRPWRPAFPDRPPPSPNANAFHAQPADGKKARTGKSTSTISATWRWAARIAQEFKSQQQYQTKCERGVLLLRRERTPDDPDVIANKRFRGLNQWLTDLPQVLGFRETAPGLHDALMEQLGKRPPLRIYAVALDLPAGSFRPHEFAQPNMIQRFTHYPPRPAYEDNEFSIAPHTDSGFMTLRSAPSAVPGLSIRLPDEHVVRRALGPGCLHVNSGDLLRRWTNDRFLSTPHRATQQRFRAETAMRSRSSSIPIPTR